jgi:hypothetical protein
VILRWYFKILLIYKAILSQKCRTNIGPIANGYASTDI